MDRGGACGVPGHGRKWCEWWKAKGSFMMAVATRRRTASLSSLALCCSTGTGRRGWGAGWVWGAQRRADYTVGWAPVLTRVPERQRGEEVRVCHRGHRDQAWAGLGGSKRGASLQKLFQHHLL
ncbi:hypothetical protein FIBSPDRAFT_369854 [Athelia psychrophila]|uniref:Uncharacterized protein n=1 Tax=Athelia psychrophila TaxID=1759441 RepID=A0A167VH94_9AGAM|nr:hypothetical protein FIBSPDRAFT_369854 [Fibularhizoctonia sp. CBS 109695]